MASPSLLHHSPPDTAALVSPLTPNAANNRALSNSNPPFTPFTPRSTTFPDNYESDSEFGDSAQNIHTPVNSTDGPHYDDLPPTYEQAQASVRSEHGSSLYRPPQSDARVRADQGVSHLERSFSLNRMLYDDSLPIPLSNQNTGVQAPVHGRGNVSRENIPVDDTAVGRHSDIPVNQLPSYGSVTSVGHAAQPPQQSRDPRISVLEQALEFTWTEPEADVQNAPALSRKIAIPPSLLLNGSTQFLRAYSKALNAHSINPAQFAAFIDGLNVICRLENFSSENAARFDNSDCLLASYLAGANEGFFAPRGLKVRLSDLRSLLGALNMSNSEERIAQILLSVRSFEADPKQKADVLIPSAEPLSFDVPEPGSQTIGLHAQAARLASRRSNTVSTRSTQGEVNNLSPTTHTELPAASSRPQAAELASHPIDRTEPSHLSPHTTHVELPGAQSTVELDAGPVPPSAPPNAPRPLEASATRAVPSPGSVHSNSNQSWAAWGEDLGERVGKWGEDFGVRMGKWGEQFGQDVARRGEAFGKTVEQHAEELSRRVSASAESSAQGARRGCGRRAGPPFGTPFGGPGGAFAGPFGAGFRPGGPFGRAPFVGPFGTTPFGGRVGPYATWGRGRHPGNPYLARGTHRGWSARGGHIAYTNAHHSHSMPHNAAHVEDENADALSLSSESSTSSESSLDEKAQYDSDFEDAKTEHARRVKNIEIRGGTDRAAKLAAAHAALAKATTKHQKRVSKVAIAREVRLMQRDLRLQYRNSLIEAKRALIYGTVAADRELAAGAIASAKGKKKRDVKGDRRKWKEERKKVRDEYKASLKELKEWKKEMEKELERSLSNGKVPVGFRGTREEDVAERIGGTEGPEVDEKGVARAMMVEAEEAANESSRARNVRSTVDVADEIWILVENLHD